MSEEQKAPKEMPSIDEFVKYGQKCVDHYLQKKASYLPKEQKEEISQDAMMRLIEAYQRLDPEKGWKAFAQRHASGSVLDYLKNGHGFEESAASLNQSKESEDQDDFEVPLRHRMSPIFEDQDQSPSVEEVAGLYGSYDPSVLEDPIGKLEPHWDLVARLASVDEDVHLVAKIIIGFRKTHLAPHFRVSRERLYQKVKKFFERLDSPELYHDPVTKQVIYAFGLARFYRMDEVDQGVGWNLTPVDLWDEESIKAMILQTEMDLPGGFSPQIPPPLRTLREFAKPQRLETAQTEDQSRNQLPLFN